MSEPQSEASRPSAASVPKAPRGHSLAGRVIWWICYAVAAGVVLGILIFNDSWWMRGAVLLIGVMTVIRFVQADRELHEKFRGHCRACGHDVFVDDPWCPGCGGSVKDVK